MCQRWMLGIPRASYGSVRRAWGQIVSILHLPQQFQPELHLPGRCGRGRYDARRWRRPSRRRCIDDRVRRVEIRVIEEVEEFRAELQIQALAKDESLRKRQVRFVQGGSL